MPNDLPKSAAIDTITRSASRIDPSTVPGLDRSGRLGELTVVAGPMFGGKSTVLLQRTLWAKNGLDRNVIVLKPSFDDRYGYQDITTHTGLQTQAIAISTWPQDLTPEVASEVFIDEVQFFCPPMVRIPDICAHINDLLDQGVNVTCAGLDTDWKGNPWEVTAKLLAMADTVIKVTASCTVCGRPATKTHKKVPDENSVELGGTDVYEARCLDHWRRPT